MARIYSPNPGHSCDYGVDFINGVAAVSDADAHLINYFTGKGYTVIPGSNQLSPWDYLTIEQLRVFAPYAGINPNGKTKSQLVQLIETTLLTLMKIEITAFDAIPDIDGGKAGDLTYADANAVIAILPDFVTATFSNGLVATVPVASWANTDSYSSSATAGKYTFTATLGNIPLPFTVAQGVTATVELEVKAA
jgi:hypothetical protein